MSLLLVLTAGGAASYTLDTTPGVYNLTGSSATLSGSRLLNISAGTYSITGLSSALLKDSVLFNSVGSYTLTGSAAELSFTAAVTNIGGYREERARLERMRQDDEEVMKLVIQAFNKIAA